MLCGQSQMWWWFEFTHIPGVFKCMCAHVYAGSPFIWLIFSALIITNLQPKIFYPCKTAFSQQSDVFFFLSFWYGFHLSWHIRWNVSQILWIYPTYPSGNEPKASVWKRKAKLESWWSEFPACHIEMNKSALFNQLEASYWCKQRHQLCVRALWLPAMHCSAYRNVA